MYSYPNLSEAVEGAKVVIAKIKDPSSISWSDAAQAGWVVQGYGQSMILPEGSSVALSNVACLACLESFVSSDATAAATIPWDQIVSWLVPLILEWLSKRLEGK